MDRFKFRVWRIKENCYNHQEPFPTCCMQENGLLAYFHEERQMLNYIVEQCTGLKDNNRKLIYEYDILKDHRGEICIVIWNNELASFMLYKTDMKSIYSPIDTDITNFEIIGNIHENPELLEAK